MTEPGVALGSRLRRHREQRSISLRAVADTTKIAYPLLEGLEHGDVSRWPHGIYRAGFIRAYAAAVGLQEDETALEFSRVFDPLPEPEPYLIPTAASPPSLRLMLAPTVHRTFSRQRATVAALDVGIVVGVALLVSLSTGFAPWPAIGCCALAYFAGSSLWPGRTPAAAWLRCEAPASAPREVQRSHTTHPPSAAAAPAAAMTLAVDDGRDGAHTTRERRTGRERRRRSAQHDPPHHGQGEGRVRGMGIPAIH